MMLKRRLNFFLLTIIVFCVSGCSEDTDSPHVPGPDDDEFSGPYCSLTLGAEARGLDAPDIELSILAPDGSVISRKATHVRRGERSDINISSGLKEGVYRLLCATYPNTQGTPGEQQLFPRAEFGLGSRIEVSRDGIKVIDPFDPVLRQAGMGTKESPYVVSSSSHLFNLMMMVNDYDSNKEIPQGTYFEQVCDIDMKQVSRSCDMEYGWLPIGADTNTPFRGIYLGGGHKITNLMSIRPRSAGIGLFGFLCDASIDGVTMSGCSVTGGYGVGALAGASISKGGGALTSATITNCYIENCTVSAGDTGACAGGVIGATDMHSRTLLSDCTVSGGTVSGGINVGGITGGAGLYSAVMISSCINRSEVKALYSGAGGMIGTGDTLQVAGCRNYALITGGDGARSSSDMPGVGTGGMVGGSGFCWITGCVNEGTVNGYEGVGGMIGSTRVKGSPTQGFVYNQAVLRYCKNSGSVSGEQFVGGAVGEAQAGAYGVCNTASVKGRKYVGGICGASSVAVVHNSANSGSVEGEAYAAGIVGKTTWGSLAIDQNTGTVKSSAGNAGGITALAGNNTVIHYCSNSGDISGPSNHAVGGIVGEIGDPREWTGLNIAECVIGSLECVMAFAGPVLAVAEEAIEFAHATEIIIKIVETSVEVCLQGADYGLVSYGIMELVSPEAEEELEASMHAMTREASDEVGSTLDEIRRNSGGEANGFTTAPLTSRYADNITGLCRYYETEGNDEKFNEAINEVREERAGKLEKAARMQEILHTCVAGVAVVTSTVALIGGSLASGGTATAFLVAGSVAAIVGGANAIIKTCTEFEHNAVVVSQCVNSGIISSPGNGHCSTIIGKMEDGCAVYDCLNTARFPAGENMFVGDYGMHCDMDRFISLSPCDDTATLYGLEKVIMCDPTMKDGTADFIGDVAFLSKDQMSDPSNFKWFSLGDNGRWIIPSSGTYPIPNISHLQK